MTSRSLRTFVFVVAVLLLASCSSGEATSAETTSTETNSAETTSAETTSADPSVGDTSRELADGVELTALTTDEATSAALLAPLLIIGSYGIDLTDAEIDCATAAFEANVGSEIADEVSNEEFSPKTIELMAESFDSCAPKLGGQIAKGTVDQLLFDAAGFTQPDRDCVLATQWSEPQDALTTVLVSVLARDGKRHLDNQRQQLEGFIDCTIVGRLSATQNRDLIDADITCVDERARELGVDDDLNINDPYASYLEACGLNDPA